MKKNITMNMLGELYHIDEDAYQLLGQYLDGMKAYFERQGADADIALDIEGRVGELLSELKGQGHSVITVDDVQAICARVGRPEQFDAGGAASDERVGAAAGMSASGGSAAGCEAASEAGGAGSDERQNGNEEVRSGAQAADAAGSQSEGEQLGWFEGLRRRRLYRDEGDKMLGGVLSGVAKWAGGGDATAWRIAFVVLLIVGVPFVSSQFIILAYIIAWALLPTAKTPEDRLRMKGVEVNAANVQSEILEDAQRRASGGSTLTGGSNNGGGDGCLMTLLKIILLCVVGFFGLIFLFILLAIVLPFMAAGSALFAESGVVTPLLVWGCLLALGVIVVPVIALLHAMFSRREFSTKTRLALLLLCVAMLVGALLCLREGGRDLFDNKDSLINNLMRSVRVHSVVIDDQDGDTIWTGSGHWVTVEDDECLPPDGAVEVFPEESEQQ